MKTSEHCRSDEQVTQMSNWNPSEQVILNWNLNRQVTYIYCNPNEQETHINWNPDEKSDSYDTKGHLQVMGST